VTVSSYRIRGDVGFRARREARKAQQHNAVRNSDACDSVT